MEIQTSALIAEISDSMNFDTEKGTDASKARTNKKKRLQILLKSFFQKKKKAAAVSTRLIKAPISSKSGSIKGHRSKFLYHAERLKEWNEMTQIESREFHKKDRLAKYKLSKIIPTEISKKR
jgi:hypothetical protein